MTERDTTWFITKRTGKEHLLHEVAYGANQDTLIMVRAVPESMINMAECAHFHKVWAVRPDTPFTAAHTRLLFGADTLREDAIHDSTVLDGHWLPIPTINELNIVPSTMQIIEATPFNYTLKEANPIIDAYPAHAQFHEAAVCVLFALSAAWLFRCIINVLKIAKAY